jgi:hypothetical protein
LPANALCVSFFRSSSWANVRALFLPFFRNGGREECRPGLPPIRLAAELHLGDTPR